MSFLHPKEAQRGDHSRVAEKASRSVGLVKWLVGSDALRVALWLLVNLSKRCRLDAA